MYVRRFNVAYEGTSPGSQSATDVAFFLIDIKYLTGFPCKAGIDFA